MLESDPLLERDASKTDLNPVELPDLEELLDFWYGECDFGGLDLLRKFFEGVTLYALPLGLDERPHPCGRGLWCLGVPRDGALPVLDPVLLTDLKLEVLDRIGNPLDEVERE